MRKEFVRVVTRCLLALGFFCAVSAQAADAQTTINVPADQPSIQAGINAAVDGDTVMVAPGTYFENLQFDGKAITVTSSGGPSVTIVDGGGVAPAAMFQGTDTSVLNGFTLQNGVPSQQVDPTGGGGITIYFASPTITNNIITGNHALCGAGMEIFSGSAVVRGNTITGNTMDNASCSGGGAGIEVTDNPNVPPAAPQIIGNTITNNSLYFANGGGIDVNGSASPLIQNNYISGNSVQGSGGGIALESNGSPLVVQNIIVNNSSGGLGSGGAGIYLSSSSSSTPTNAMLINNTIANNDGLDGSSGIYADVVSPVPVINNIVVAAPGENGIVCNPASTVFPSFSHNDVLSPGTGGQAWSTKCASFAQSNGNISADPQFVNEAGGDYHLTAGSPPLAGGDLNHGSPALDAGDNTAPNLPQQDYDGNLRVVDGNFDCVDTVDLGPYELQTTAQVSFGATFAFPDQIVNTTSRQVSFNLVSSGTGCLKITAISITGDFAQTNDCPALLPASEVCAVFVTFTPTTTGLRTGILTMTGNQVPPPTGGRPEVDLSGNGVDPVGAVTPSSLTFDTQVVNTSSAAQIVTLSNTGIGALQISSIGISSDFSETNNCTAMLNAGTSCVIQVSFSPKATGARTGSLTISSNSIVPVPSISLSGTAVQPAINVSPASISFGDQLINTSAPDQIITVTNLGSALLHVSSAVVSGSLDLSVILNNCSVAVPPGGSCTIEVGFTPRSAGAASATLSIGSDAPTSPTSVALSGKGIDPIGTLSPSVLNFGNQQINTSSAAQTVTLSNTGTDPLTISGVSVSGDFTQSNACPATLAVGSSCTIQVTFHPTASGTRSGSLSVASNSSPPVGSDAMTGTGVDPQISVSPATITFADQPINTDAPAQTITVSNPGTTTLHVNSLSISGDPDFFTLTNNCVSGTGVAPGGTCTIQTEFQPQTAGPGSATLTIGSDAANGPVSVSLSGTGVNPVIATVSPTSLNFGNQAVGSQSPTQIISLTNTGTGVITVSGVAITGDPDFILVDNGCAGGFAAGITCPIRIAFAPKSLGTGSATLTITSNASNNPVSVALSGTGVTPPQASVSPASIDFGNVSIGAHNATPVFTVSNTGGAVLHINSLSITGDTDFLTVTNNCVGGTGVAPGGSCTIQMEFQPQTVGPASATLSITSDAPTSPTNIGLSGNGTGPDYSVSASPASLSIRSGHQGQTKITVSAVGGSVSTSVALSCSNLPTGASCSFSPSSVVPGTTSASSSLTINTQQSGGIKTPLGAYSITVLGTSAGVVRSTVVTITITN